MSTADSQLLAASSAISQNLAVEVLHINMSKKTSMLVARLTVVVISVISIFFALDPTSSVFKIVSFAWQVLVRHSVLWFSAHFSGRELISTELYQE